MSNPDPTMERARRVPARQVPARQLRRILWWVGLLALGLSYLVVSDLGQFLIRPPILLEFPFFGSALPLFLGQGFWQSALSALLFFAGVGCLISCFVLWLIHFAAVRPRSGWDYVRCLVIFVVAEAAIAGAGFIALFNLSDLADSLTNQVLVVPAVSPDDGLMVGTASPSGCRVVLRTNREMMGPTVTSIYIQNPGYRHLSFLTSIAIEDDQAQAVAYSSVRWDETYPDGDIGTVFITGPAAEVTVVCPLAS